MELNMSKITKKGQITIPKEIRNKFGFLPGTDVDIIAEGNEAYIVKARRKNIFLQWLGRGKQREKNDIDFLVDKLRGRTDE